MFIHVLFIREFHERIILRLMLWNVQNVLVTWR